MEVFINNKKLDADDNIEIVRQVIDIFDISTRVVDYSKTIKAYPTANNKEILEGLGFSDSEFPYKRSFGDAYEQGILVMNNAFVKVKEYNKTSYSLNLISESKEIWKVIQNDTLGQLDLSSTEHTKTAGLLKLQWEAGIQSDTEFIYIYADYGGQLPKNNELNADYIIPCYKLDYLVKLEKTVKLTTQFRCKLTPSFGSN